MPPSRKPPWNAAEDWPRLSGGATRSSSENADTVNIAEPKPPAPRSTISWLRSCAKPDSALLIPTIRKPTVIILRSLTRPMSRPHSGALTKRAAANTAMTKPAWKLLPPSCLANSTIDGATIPKPERDEERHDRQDMDLARQVTGERASHEAPILAFGSPGRPARRPATGRIRA